jgi:hypothetical protein
VALVDQYRLGAPSASFLKRRVHVRPVPITLGSTRNPFSVDIKMSEASGFAMACGQATSLREARVTPNGIFSRRCTPSMVCPHRSSPSPRTRRSRGAHRALLVIRDGSRASRYGCGVVTARVAAVQAAGPASVPPPAVTYVQSPAGLALELF